MSQVATDTAVRVENVHHAYGSGAAAVHALRGVSLEVPRGEFVVLRGRPGAGRSTLLNLVGGLDEPDAGRITVDGLEPGALDEDALLELRRDRIGFLLPSAGLVPVLTVAENVALPLRLTGTPAHEHGDRVERLLSSSAWPATRRAGPGNCPPDSAAAWPSRAPSSTAPRSCSPTNPPAGSTPKPASPSWNCCTPSSATNTRQPWSPHVTPPRRPRPTGCWS